MLRDDSALDSYVRPFLSARNRKPYHRIFRESLGYKTFYNLRPKEYFFLALYMDYIDDEVEKYIPNGPVYHFNIVMNGELRPALIEDKSRTSARLAEHQVHCVQEFMSWSKAHGFVGVDGVGLSVAQACEAIANVGGRAFAKPLSANKGRGARIVAADPDALRQFATGDEVLIFQPVIEQHPVLAALNPSAVNTIRINTLLVDDRVECHVATLRVGRQGGIVDNAAAGGLCVKIDMATGRLGSFARAKPIYSTQSYTHHPDTGVAFGTLAIPFWPEVLELVGRAARAMAPLRSLGWDVAVTSRGPIVIEANAAWSPNVFQLCQPLGGTGLGKRILAVSGRPHPWPVPGA